MKKRKEWVVKIKSSKLNSLKKSFSNGIIIDGKHLIVEKTVGRINGLKVQIFADEHPPPHFRVIYQGESNNFTIKDAKPLNGDALKKWHGNIKKWHSENKNLLIEEWNKNRPTDCPVKEYKE